MIRRAIVRYSCVGRYRETKKIQMNFTVKGFLVLLVHYLSEGFKARL